jgi:hypothetical protein
MSETTTERYDRLAEEFYRETGMMAPGKDVAAAMAEDNNRERFTAWIAWLKAHARRPSVEVEK